MHAIVLHRRDYRESDQIIAVYTREQGRLDLLARGVKKIVSKNTAQLEPFSVVRIETTPGKEFQYLIKVYGVEYFSDIRSDLLKTAIAAFVMNTLYRLLQSWQVDERIFDLTYLFLTHLENSQNRPSLMFSMDVFFLKLMCLFGFEPVTDRCTLTEMLLKDFEKEKPFGFYFQGGGIICPKEFEMKKKIGEHVVAINKPQLFLLELFLEKGFSAFDMGNFDKKIAHELHQLVYEFTLYHNEKEIADWSKALRVFGEGG
ncbi:DNA repair protein RecO [Candidatus Nomurabacteria bacterium]|nr:DNA repair protein RecO [Candidatus Nomurabacteria bacterium]